MIKIVIKIVTRKVLPQENNHEFIYRNQAFNDWLLHKYFSNCIVRWGTGFSCEGGGLWMYLLKIILKIGDHHLMIFRADA